MEKKEKKDKAGVKISRFMPGKNHGRAAVKIKHYSRPPSSNKTNYSKDGRVTLLPEMAIPEDVMSEHGTSRNKIHYPRRVKKPAKKLEEKPIDESYLNLKTEILEMGSKLTEVEGRLQERTVRRQEPPRRPMRSESHYNLLESTPVPPPYRPSDFSERPRIYRTSIIPNPAVRNVDVKSSHISSNAEVDKVIKNIRSEIEKWKKNKLNAQGKSSFGEETNIDVAASDVREEAERDAERAISTAPSKCQTDSSHSDSSSPKHSRSSRPSSHNPALFSRNTEGSSSSLEKFSQHSHYPLDKYLPKDVLADLPQINDFSLAENRCKQFELFGTLTTMTKELERLKGPVLRRSVSDITTNSINDSESCYTEELVETQFRKATYAYRKKLDVHRKKSHFTMVNDRKMMNKENERSPYRESYGPVRPDMPSTSYQNFHPSYPDMRTQYERNPQYTPRYDEYNRDSRQYRRSPVSPGTPGYDNYYSTTAQPGSANSQQYPVWSANSNGQNSVGTPYRPDSYNRRREFLDRTMRRPEKLSPRFPPQKVPDLGAQSSNFHAQLKHKAVHDVCVNTDFINSSVYNFKSKFDIVEKEEKSNNKSFAVQQLPKLSIRPQLVTQVGPNVNIWPHRVSKSKNNVGILEIVHPPRFDSEKSEEKSKEQYFQPKTFPNGAKTNKKRNILTEEKPEEKREEPKLVRVAEEFCNTIGSKKHQEYVHLKDSLQSLLSCVNDLYDNQVCTNEEIKAALGVSPSNEELPRRLNMVADLLEDENGKFGTQNLDHYERLGRVVNVLVDDIQTSLNALDSQKEGDIKDASKGSNVKKNPYRPPMTPFKSRLCEEDLRVDGKADYKTQKNLELRLARIEKLYEINKTLKETMAASPLDASSYESNQTDTTSYDMDVTKSETSEEKSFSDKPVEEKLNETFIIYENDKKVGTDDVDKNYLRTLQDKADQIIKRFAPKNEEEKVVLKTKPKTLPGTSKASWKPKIELFDEIKKLNEELKQIKVAQVQNEVEPEEGPRDEIEVIHEEVQVVEKKPEETQTDIKTVSDQEVQVENFEKKQEETQTELPCFSASIQTEDEIIDAVQPVNTLAIPPASLSPSLKNDAQPLLKFSNPLTKSSLEIRLPEDQFSSSIVVQTTPKGDDFQLSYKKGKESKEISTSYEAKFDESVQVSISSSKSQTIPENIDPMNNLLNQLSRFLELRVSEIVQNDRSSKKAIDDLSLSDLENIQDLNKTDFCRTDCSNESLKPSPRLLPLPQTVLEKKDKDVQADFPIAIRPRPGSKEAEDVDLRKKVRDELDEIFKVRSLDSIQNFPKTLSPKPFKPLIVHDSKDSLNIKYWDSDQMSEGEVGIVLTEKSYSSGEIRPRPTELNLTIETIKSSEESMLNALKKFYKIETPVHCPDTKSDEISDSESETTPETTTSETTESSGE